MRLSLYLAIAMTMAIACFLTLPQPVQAETLSFSHAQLKNRDFSGRNLVGSGFANANMEGANFENADVRGAVFSASILRKANLKGTDFSGGLLDQADFARADLSNALLVETILLRSTFDFVNIDGADFTDAIMDGAQRKWLCSKAKGTNAKTGINTRASLECD
ncbi:pentapeptide repeat-containing protein [Pseudanabaena sp. 'Roaring Creek']|uniref:pentapeptide repeat-containing protein n=1 Tax=Pseudanabaena sp. 'Roaring Creek' TaxID=1681830 RepID=UPI001E5B7CA4|nr:pentapeptide repeat-containing protein [Pseudanabaena sp. 'Roaring Creek']